MKSACTKMFEMYTCYVLEVWDLMIWKVEPVGTLMNFGLSNKLKLLNIDSLKLSNFEIFGILNVVPLKVWSFEIWSFATLTCAMLNPCLGIMEKAGPNIWRYVSVFSGILNMGWRSPRKHEMNFWEYGIIQSVKLRILKLWNEETKKPTNHKTCVFSIKEVYILVILNT